LIILIETIRARPETNPEAGGMTPADDVTLNTFLTDQKQGGRTSGPSSRSALLVPTAQPSPGRLEDGNNRFRPDGKKTRFMGIISMGRSLPALGGPGLPSGLAVMGIIKD